MSDKTYIGPIRITDSDGIPVDAYVGSNGNDTVRTSEYMPSAVWGAAGDDTIIQKGIGATYWFGRGDGHDTIVGYDRNFDTVYDGSGGKGPLVVCLPRNPSRGWRRLSLGRQGRQPSLRERLTKNRLRAEPRKSGPPAGR